MTEIYRLMYKDNEIQLEEGKCLQPWNCQCYPKDSKHETRFSDSSFYDVICTKCGATDGYTDFRLELPCPGTHNKPPSQCGYTVKEAKLKIIEYYRKRADDIVKMSDEDFLKEHGIYI